MRGVIRGRRQKTKGTHVFCNSTTNQTGIGNPKVEGDKWQKFFVTAQLTRQELATQKWKGINGRSFLVSGYTLGINRVNDRSGCGE